MVRNQISLEGFATFIKSRWSVLCGFVAFSSYLAQFMDAMSLPTKLQTAGWVITLISSMIVFLLAYVSTTLPRAKSCEKTSKSAVRFFVLALVSSVLYLFFSTAFVYTIEAPDGTKFRIIEGSGINPKFNNVIYNKTEIIQGREHSTKRESPLSKEELYDKLGPHRVITEAYTHDSIRWEMALKVGVLYTTYISMFLLIIAAFGVLMANMYIVEMENKTS